MVDQMKHTSEEFQKILEEAEKQLEEIHQELKETMKKFSNFSLEILKEEKDEDRS